MIPDNIDLIPPDIPQSGGSGIHGKIQGGPPMKIGELSRLCGVPQATIRYYVKTGLLIPDDKGAQYNFTEREHRDLELILKLKRRHFNLKEIQNYLVLTRHSNLIEPDTIAASRKILEGKLSELNHEIALLQQSVLEIEQELYALNPGSGAAADRTGVPIRALSLLVCPHCGRPLVIDGAAIEGGFILSGQLSCPSPKDCPGFGYLAKIENGIVKTANRYTGEYDEPDLKRGLYRDMSPEFSTALQRCYDFISGGLEEMDLHGKVILEAYINGYFFLYHHLSLVPEDCLCIVVDKYPEMLEMYKQLIEQMGIRTPILYIADADSVLPLKEGSVDVHISCMGEDEHQFYHSGIFAGEAKPYFKSDVRILGAYFGYDRNSETRRKIRKKYPEASLRGHQVDYLREDYRKAGFRIELSEVGRTTDSGSLRYSFECHVKGERLMVYRFLAVPEH